MQTEIRRDQKGPIQRYGWLLLLAAIVIATVAYIVEHRDHSRQGVAVSTATVVRGDVTQQIFSTGTVASVHTASLFPPGGVTGSPDIKVSVGETVKKGQIVAVYPTNSLKNQLSVSQSVASAQGDILASAQKLVDNANKSGVSHTSSAYIQLEQSVKEDEIQYQNAESQVRQAEAALSAASVKAPFAGTVVAVSGNDAASQLASTPLVQISDLKDLEINAALSQANAALVVPGKEVTITSSSFPGESWTGEIKLVAPIATSTDGGSANVDVTASVPANFPIHPGFTVNLTIDAQSVTGLKIPYSALVESGNGSQVWVVKNGQVQLVNVQLGVTGDKDAQVTSGVHAGDKVVVNPPQGLVTGEDVSAK